MTDSKNTNKVRIEGAGGNRITLADASNVQQKYLLSKLQTLDHDADGCICLDDLLRVVESEAKLRSTAQKYQRFIVGLGIAVMVMFGVTLGSSILSVNLMKEFVVNKGSLVGKDGQVLLVGSSDFVVVDGALHSSNASHGMSLQVVPQRPVINNVLPKSASRRLINGSVAMENSTGVEDDRSGEEMYHVPRADFNRAIAIFKSGTVGLTVPLGSDIVAVTMDHLQVNKNGERVSGSAAGVQWTSLCESGEDKCEISVTRTMGPSSEEELDPDYLGEDDNSTRLLSTLPDEDYLEEDNSDRLLATRASARQLSDGCPAGVHGVHKDTMLIHCMEEAMEGKNGVTYSKLSVDECWYSLPFVGWSRRRTHFCRHRCNADSEMSRNRPCRRRGTKGSTSSKKFGNGIDNNWQAAR